MKYLIPLTLLLAPTYAVRFSIGGFPTNLLMLWVFFVWIVFACYLLLTKQIPAFLQSVKNNSFRLFVGLFFLSGIISLFVGGINQKTLGAFLVLFLQPISLFFIAKFIYGKFPGYKTFILYTVYLILAASGVYAALQYFAGLGLPLLFQGNDFEPKRAVSFFVHSNFYALFAAPLLAFLVPDVLLRIKDKGLRISFPWYFAWLLGALGLLLSLSRAGWIGLAAAIVVYIIISGDKKLRQTAALLAIVIVIVITITPSLRSRLTAPFHGEKSSSSRVTLWQSGIKAIKESPAFGLGLNGYSKNYRELITDQTLPDHNFPHNIFLNLWVETGLIGLIGMIGLMGTAIYRGLKNKKDIVKLSVVLFLVALLTQGLIDNPYFKNDLAVVFWILLAIF